MASSKQKVLFLVSILLYLSSNSNAIPLSAMTQKSIQLYSAIDQQIASSGFNLNINSITSEINNAGLPTITYTVYLQTNSFKWNI